MSVYSAAFAKMGTVDNPGGTTVDDVVRWPAAGTLCRGVAWPDRRPELDLVAVDTGAYQPTALLHGRLGLRMVAAGPFCLGATRTVDRRLARLPCPRQARAVSGRQCEECAAQDEFRFAHHVHLGGYVPDALARYLDQPHWVYVATFADATSKVGTASGPRKTSRLDEQGAVRATYVAHTPDGRIARVFEDAITERAGIAQTKRRATKAAALERPATAETLGAEHRDAVGQAIEVLASRADHPGVELHREPWEPPTAMLGFFDDIPIGGWLPYPHNLLGGDHGFHIDAVAGSTALARLRDHDDVRYVVDLGALAGCRIALGSYVSPDTPVQMSLF
jgi:hypothetical protein